MSKFDNDRSLINDQEKAGLYKTIFNRRDVRSEFTSKEIPNDVVARILKAAHHAPSVGFMQPWNFILVQSPTVKQAISQAFSAANKEAENMFKGEQRRMYSQLKLAGIQAAPLNICITCDPNKAGSVVLGRTHNPMMDQYSTVCAVQNLLLAARAEGVGAGWVSIFNEHELKSILNIPKDVVPVAYLCLGYVTEFYREPELQVKGWRSRLPLADTIYFDQWSETPKDDENDGFLKEVGRIEDS